MMLDIAIQQAPDHLLIRHLGPRSVSLKEIDTPFAKGDSYLDAVISQHQLMGRGKEVTNYFNPSKRLIFVLYLAFHKVFSLGANIRHQRFE
jgi:hypothetical protein